MALDQPDIKLVDNRDKDEWLGISSAPAKALGMNGRATPRCLQGLYGLVGAR